MPKFLTSLDLRKTFFKVLVSMLMVFVLLISVASPSHAVVGVTSILIPAVIATLGAWGIGTAVDGLDGEDIAEWFHDKLTDWSTYAGIALENIVIGIKMTPLGQVLLNPVASMAIKDFAGWFIQQNGLTAGGSPVQVISGSAVLVLSPLQSVFLGRYTRTGLDRAVSVSASGVGLYFYTNNAGVHYPVFISSEALSFDAVVLSGGSSTTYQVSLSPTQGNNGGMAYTSIFVYGTVDANVNSNIPVYPSYSSGIDAFSSSSSDGTLALVPASSLYVPTTSDLQDKELLIDAGLNVGVDAASWYDGVMQKVAANDLTVTGTLTQAGSITADQVIDQGAITEQEGVVSWPDVTVPIGVSGLDEIFPFCIPFDIYHFVEALAAEPVAPSFEIPFRIEGVVDYTFEIDLEPFDQVAQVLRLVELLAFCVGLAFVTRSMFIRG